MRLMLHVRGAHELVAVTDAAWFVRLLNFRELKMLRATLLATAMLTAALVPARAQEAADRPAFVVTFIEMAASGTADAAKLLRGGRRVEPQGIRQSSLRSAGTDGLAEPLRHSRGLARREIVRSHHGGCCHDPVSCQN